MADPPADMSPALLAAFRRRVMEHLEGQIAREDAEAVARRSAVLPAVEAAAREARERGLVDRLWLYGSYAWGKPLDRSDLDVAFQGAPDPDALARVIEQHVRLPLHLYDLDRMPASLRERVLADGRPL